MHRFRRTDCWVFDLDNTLYPADCNLFAEVDRRMSDFVARLLGVPLEDARRMQKAYYHRHGTTLRGLMREHGLRPDEFLAFVHDIDLSPVQPAPALRAALGRLPGRKYIFTNGSRRHAENVAGKLGVLDCFDDIFDIGAADYVPKPDRAAYDAFLRAHGVSGPAAAMFEDMPHNLETAHALGMATVLVRSPTFDHPAQRDVAGWSRLPDHIHHLTDDLTDFLQRVGGHIVASSNAPAD